MLFFTSPKFDAIYSGRFAFILGVESSHLARLVAETARLRDRPGSTSFDEEFRHSRVYLSCYTGLVVSGLRMLTRLIWVTAGSERAVAAYYRLRTAYYAVMYPLHEMLVGGADHGGRRRGLFRAQWRVAWLWLTRCRMPTIAALVLVTSPFWAVLGWMLAKDFTVIEQRIADGRLVERNLSTGRYVNVVGSVGLERPSPLQRLLSLGQLERYFVSKPDRDWRWMLQKFDSERAAWSEVVRPNLSEWPYAVEFDDYAAAIVGFAAHWAHLGFGPIRRVLAAVMDASENKAERRFPPGWADDPQRRKMVNFFYLHGN